MPTCRAIAAACRLVESGFFSRTTAAARCTASSRTSASFTVLALARLERLLVGPEDATERDVLRRVAGS